MNLSNNFNYSGLKSQIDIGEIVVDFGYNYTPGQVKYVSATDDFETWRTVPKKTIPNPIGSGYVTIVPYAPKGKANLNLTYQRRQLWINPIGGGQENVPLPSTVGKKWFLDSISFKAYDMHEFVPNWYPNALIESMGGLDVTDLYITDGWSVGIDAIVIGFNDSDIVTWKTAPYTTAAYPDFSFINTDYMYNPDGTPYPAPTVGVGKYGDNWATYDTMNQSASRSGVVGGLLSSDWFPNQFSFNISGSSSPTGIVTGVTDMIFGSDMLTTNRQGASDWAHTSLPLQLSNMNIEINYPYLGIEVYGGGHYQYLYWGENPQADNSIKGFTTTAVVPRTIAQYPIICELIIVQR